MNPGPAGALATHALRGQMPEPLALGEGKGVATLRFIRLGVSHGLTN
jgi:hypothetical protein